MDTEHIATTEPARRLEVFTGAGRRRTWRDEDKTRIVAEIATRGDSVCAWLAAMDYHRSSCLAGDVNCEIPKLNVLRLSGCSSYRQLLMLDHLLFRNRGRRGAKRTPVPERLKSRSTA
jgi:hypothetical protein